MVYAYFIALSRRRRTKYWCHSYLYVCQKLTMDRCIDSRQVGSGYCRAGVTMRWVTRGQIQGQSFGFQMAIVIRDETLVSSRS